MSRLYKIRWRPQLLLAPASKNRSSHIWNLTTIKRPALCRQTLVRQVERGFEYDPPDIYKHHAQSDSCPHVAQSSFPRLDQRTTHLHAHVARRQSLFEHKWKPPVSGSRGSLIKTWPTSTPFGQFQRPPDGGAYSWDGAKQTALKRSIADPLQLTRMPQDDRGEQGADEGSSNRE